MTARLQRERGAALLSVLVGVAVLTALAANLAYESRVSLRIAANARDELRASYEARSGVALSRLVLSFQQQLDDTTGRTATSIPTPRIQLWRALPVASELVAGLFGGGAPPPALAAEGRASAGGARFDAIVEDEATKINAQLEGLPRTNLMLGPQILSLYQLICDPRWDPLFDREDANGFKTTREELIVRLRDWVDEGEQSSALRATFGTTSCGMVPLQPPFEDAFGDENQPYDRGDDRYRTRNAHMDSLDELYLVAGVSDAFMAAFGDALTVYVPRDGKQNVNDLDRTRLLNNARRIADPQLQPTLYEPAFLDRLQAILMERTLGGILSISPMEFGQAVQLAGVQVNSALLADSNINNPFTDRSTTFRIRSTGTAGDVKTTIQAIVRLEKATQGEPVGAPGRVIHWREE